MEPTSTITAGLSLFSSSEICVVRGGARRTRQVDAAAACARCTRPMPAAGGRAGRRGAGGGAAAVPQPHSAAPAGGAAAGALVLQGAAEEPLQVPAVEERRAAFPLRAGAPLASRACCPARRRAEQRDAARLRQAEAVQQASVLAQLHKHRNVLGVIGVCHCPSITSIGAAYEEFERLCRCAAAVPVQLAAPSAGARRAASGARAAAGRTPRPSRCAASRSSPATRRWRRTRRTRSTCSCSRPRRTARRPRPAPPASRSGLVRAPPARRLQPGRLRRRPAEPGEPRGGGHAGLCGQPAGGAGALDADRQPRDGGPQHLLRHLRQARGARVGGGGGAAPPAHRRGAPLGRRPPRRPARRALQSRLLAVAARARGNARGLRRSAGARAQEVSRKRRYGRLQKAMGDVSLLAGSPSDAADHYATALELARVSGDAVWAGASLEGVACAKARGRRARARPAPAAPLARTARPTRAAARRRCWTPA